MFDERTNSKPGQSEMISSERSSSEVEIPQHALVSSQLASDCFTLDFLELIQKFFCLALA